MSSESAVIETKVDFEDGDETKKEEEEEEELTLDQELRFYVAEGNEEKIKELVKLGADVNTNDDVRGIAADSQLKENDDSSSTIDLNHVYDKVTGDYPLHIAAEHNHPNIVKQLFFLGAIAENKNRIGSTALHRAVSFGHSDVVIELLNTAADIHAKNRIGNTPLHIACLTGNLDMIKLLLNPSGHGIKDAEGARDDLRVKNKVFMTPIEYTVPETPARQFLLQFDPTLADFVEDEEQGEEEEKKSE